MCGNTRRRSARLTARQGDIDHRFLSVLARDCIRSQAKICEEAATYLLVLEGDSQSRTAEDECTTPEIRVSIVEASHGSEGLIKPDSAGVTMGLS